MSSDVNRQRIAQDLHADCEISEDQLRAWILRQNGYTGREISKLLRRSPRTIYRWYNLTDEKINQIATNQRAEGEALTTVPICRGGVLQVEYDMALTNLFPQQ